jgi:chromosome segregation ATPase
VQGCAPTGEPAPFAAEDLAWFRREWPVRERELVEALAQRDEAERREKNAATELARPQARTAGWAAERVALEERAANLEARLDAVERHREELARHALNLEQALTASRVRCEELTLHAAEVEQAASAADRSLRTSWSWRLTRPLRAAVHLLRGR